MELENLGQHRRGRFWIDNVPPIKYEIIEILTSSITPAVSYPSNQHNAIALELMLPRHSSSYVFLGVRFEPTDGELVNIQVGLSKDKDAILQDNIAFTSDQVYVGIPKEYGPKVLESAMQTVKDLSDFPAGILIFDVGAHGLVGSSQAIFSMATCTLIRLIYRKLQGVPANELIDLVTVEIQRSGLIGIPNGRPNFT